MFVSAPATVAKHLLATYGKERAAALLDRLEACESLASIGRDYGVSRERVRQWAASLGYYVSTYQVHPDVDRIARERGPILVKKASTRLRIQ